MSLTIEEVEHIAELARLELSDEEKTRYRQQLSAVLDHFQDLVKIDTTGISSSFSVMPQNSARLREDKALQSLSSEKLLDNAPSHENFLFKVPPIIDYEG